MDVELRPVTNLVGGLPDDERRLPAGRHDIPRGPIDLCGLPF